MKATDSDQDSALRVEMSALEDQADDGKARELHWKPMSWLGTLRPTTVDDAWAPAIWQTFFTSTLGLEVPVLSSLLIFQLFEIYNLVYYNFGSPNSSGQSRVQKK